MSRVYIIGFLQYCYQGEKCVVNQRKHYSLWLCLCRFDFLIGKIEETETNRVSGVYHCTVSVQRNSCPPASMHPTCGLTYFLASLIEEIV